jgi:hypothetical protein
MHQIMGLPAEFSMGVTLVGCINCGISIVKIFLLQAMEAHRVAKG